MSLPLLMAFGRTVEPWLVFDPVCLRSAHGRAAAATAHPLASWAALCVLRDGGSAVDGAIAAQLVLNVVEPHASGIGGGAVMLVAANGAVHAIDGLSAAPAGVAQGRTANGARTRKQPGLGGRTVGVPGALRAMEQAHLRFGRLPWAHLFTPATALADAGFPLAPYLSRTLREVPDMHRECLAHALFYAGTDAPLPVGARLRNPRLALALRRIAHGGAEAFYHGELAREMVRAVQDGPSTGFLTEHDLAVYRAVDRAPVHFPLGHFSVCSAALPAMGGVAVGQILGIAARLGLTRIGRDLSAADIHVLAQAGRAAFAHRRLYGDPDFVPVDAAALLDPAYLDACAREVDCQAGDSSPPPSEQGLADSMTSHICVADAAGVVVSMTTTINSNFGARISVSGFYLNNVLTNFADERTSRPSCAANALAPGKRPRTTIAPCIVLDPSGRPVAAIGAGGGWRIIGYVANGLLRLAAGERDPQALVAAPHAMNWGGLTELEPPLGRHADALSARGHRVVTRPMDGGTQCLLLDANGVAAGGDTRRDGAAMAIGA